MERTHYADSIRYAAMGIDQAAFIPEHLTGAKKDQKETDLLIREFQRRLNAHFENLLLSATTMMPFPPNQFTHLFYKGEPMDQERLKKGNVLLKEIERIKGIISFITKAVSNGPFSFNLSGVPGSSPIVSSSDHPSEAALLVEVATAWFEKKLGQLEKEFEAL